MMVHARKEKMEIDKQESIIDLSLTRTTLRWTLSARDQKKRTRRRTRIGMGLRDLMSKTEKKIDIVIATVTNH